MTKKIKQNGPTMVKGIFAVGGVSAILGKPMSGATFDLEMFRWVNESGDDVALVFEVQERPKLAVPANDHVPPTAPVSTVRTALRGGLVAVHVR